MTQSNPKFVMMYIEYIEEASFCGLTMRSSALERHPTRRG
jgi:hypothetical protein